MIASSGCARGDLALTLTFVVACEADALYALHGARVIERKPLRNDAKRSEKFWQFVCSVRSRVAGDIGLSLRSVLLGKQVQDRPPSIGLQRRLQQPLIVGDVLPMNKVCDRVAL